MVSVSPSLTPPRYLPFLGAVLAWLVVASVGAADASSSCVNVEEPGYQGGDRQCFGSDEIGMVCGWDGTPDEAYCEIGLEKLKPR